MSKCEDKGEDAASSTPANEGDAAAPAQGIVMFIVILFNQ